MKKFFFVTLLVILAAILYFAFFHRRVVVVVINERDIEVTEISIQYNGGSIEIPVLSPKSLKKNRINASGESSLTVKFKDPSTQNIQIESLDIYFERNYSGTIEIKFGADGKFSWRDNIRVSWW